MVPVNFNVVVYVTQIKVLLCKQHIFGLCHSPLNSMKKRLSFVNNVFESKVRGTLLA